MKLAATTNVQPEYLAMQFSYTTADIEQARFSGATPDPLYFVMSKPPVGTPPTTLIVIDGELCVVRHEAPPGARPPSGQLFARLLEFADTPTLPSV